MNRAMIAMETPQVPACAVEFAKAVGELADKHSISEFHMKIRVDRNMSMGPGEPTIFYEQDMDVDFYAKDGRARPCRNLSLTFRATNIHKIESTPRSIS